MAKLFTLGMAHEPIPVICIFRPWSAKHHWLQAFWELDWQRMNRWNENWIAIAAYASDQNTFWNGNLCSLQAQCEKDWVWQHWVTSFTLFFFTQSRTDSKKLSGNYYVMIVRGNSWLSFGRKYITSKSRWGWAFIIPSFNLPNFFSFDFNL